MWIAFWLQRAKVLANCPCNYWYFPRFPTYVITIHQRHGRTTCDRKTAVCTKVHCAVKSAQCAISAMPPVARDYIRQYAISQRCSIESQSPAVFEILSPKHIGVTTLTLQGHVTSSITWPFDSQYAISYWWSIRTGPLSVNIFKIFGPTLVQEHANQQINKDDDL